MTPANYYYGYPSSPGTYNPSGFAFSPMAPGYPVYPPHIGHQPGIPSLHPNMNFPHLYTAPSLASLPRIIPHPSQIRNPTAHQPQPATMSMQPTQRQNIYRNMQNDFSRGYEFDYDFLSSESSAQKTNRKTWDGNSAYSHYGSTSVIPHSMSEMKNYYPNGKHHKRTYSLSYNHKHLHSKLQIFRNTKKILTACHQKFSQAGVLFTAILYSMCDCLFSSSPLEPTNHYDFLDTKLLEAYDGSRLDLSKMRLPHDRLMTEESIENLEFEILENRAYRLDKDETSSHFLFNWKIMKNL